METNNMSNQEQSEQEREAAREKKKSMIEKEEIVKLLSSYQQFDATQADPQLTFQQFPLSVKMKRGLRDYGYKVPTEIQRQSIGFALKGNDVLGAAKTGSGKTLAFIIPMLECLYREQWTEFDGLGGLIITPTRELAYQIFEVLRRVGGYHEFSAGLVIGGKDLKFERRRMGNLNIVICTPGRLLQHMDENPLFNCDNLKMLVLDEADRILDLGFAKAMNAIIDNLPTQRQTLLFSATQTKSVKDLARLSLKDPVYVSTHEHAKFSTPESLTQSCIVCNQSDKLNVLWSFIRSHLKCKILVFMSTCKQVKYVYDLFCRLRPGVTLMALYGTLHQLKRMHIYDTFCQKEHAVLFATDIASRGLDFPSINWVIQLDCPEDVNTYIHRVGRTARYQKGGESLLVLLPGEEESMIKQLTDKKIPINKIEVNPSKIHSIQRKCEAMCARDNTLKESAQRAFKSYLKNVFMMKDKTVFNVDHISNDAFATSLGLAITPRIRFIEKSVKAKLNKKNDIDNEKERKLGKDKQDKKKKDEDAKQTSKPSFNVSSSESEEDIFSVKKVWRFDEEGEDDKLMIGEPSMEKKNDKKKKLTKTALAKRVLKKKLTSNTKILFDEEGKPIIDFPTRQMSEKVKQLEEKDVAGIDIELAKEIMAEEDKIDKKLQKDLIKAKHREEKLKRKQRNRQKEMNAKAKLKDKEDNDEEEDEMDEHTAALIDQLPDPDKYYGQNDEESDEGEEDDDEDNEEDDDEESEVEAGPSQPSKKRKVYKSESDDSEDGDNRKVTSGLSLDDQEALALHLLGQ